MDDDNWSLRLPNAFESEYAANLATGNAMDVLAGFAAALRAAEPAREQRLGLTAELDRRARQWRAGATESRDG